MNGILILKNLKSVAILLWALATLSGVFNLFNNSEIITKDQLNSLRYIGIALYVIFHLFELRLTLKQKNTEIAKLKTRLLKYEN